MELNKSGLDILKFCEGFYQKAYLCPAGKWTIGWGTTVYPNGMHVSIGDECTEDQAAEWLQYELEHKSLTIKDWALRNKLSFNDNQFSALLCFAYNLGCGPIIDADRSLCQALIHNKGIREAFNMYVKATKKIMGISYKVTLAGLVTRRKLEADLYFTL